MLYLIDTSPISHDGIYYHTMETLETMDSLEVKQNKVL